MQGIGCHIGNDLPSTSGSLLKNIISDFFVINAIIMFVLFFAKIIDIRISSIFMLIILILVNIEIAYLEVKYAA